MNCSLLEQGVQALMKDAEIERLAAPRYDEIISLLSRYIKEIELFNPAYGLVGAKDSEELIVKHILDSLAPLGIISHLLNEICMEGTPRIADVGSGAGLPGIPLAIAMPNCEFTLIERTGRRAGFLCGAKAVLNLSNVAVEEAELSNFVGREKTAANRFSLVTFRAFKPLEPKLLKTLLRACEPGGVIAAYKGRRDKTDAEAAALGDIRGKWEILPCVVPFLDEERHLLIIRVK